MSKRPIGVVTFDLWDCLFCDETDEPKRAAAGLPPKPEARRQLLYEHLNQEAPIDRNLVDIAFNVSDAAFRKAWHEQFVTWSVAERIQLMLDGLKRTLPPAGLAAVVEGIEHMELDYSPDPAPGGLEALAAPPRQLQTRSHFGYGIFTREKLTRSARKIRYAALF